MVAKLREQLGRALRLWRREQLGRTSSWSFWDELVNGGGRVNGARGGWGDVPWVGGEGDAFDGLNARGEEKRRGKGRDDVPLPSSSSRGVRPSALSDRHLVAQPWNDA